MLLLGLNCSDLSMPLSTVGLFANGSGNFVAACYAAMTCASDMRVMRGFPAFKLFVVCCRKLRFCAGTPEA